MREVLTSAAELAGIGLVADGLYRAWEPLGFIFGGLALIAVGFLAGGRRLDDRHRARGRRR